MNNIDASIIQVLKSLHPDIFGLYFNDFGTIPNPDRATRQRARQLFGEYSPTNFDAFMRRYRQRRGGSDEVSVRCPTLPEPLRSAVKKELDVVAFLREKQQRRDCVPLQWDEGPHETPQSGGGVDVLTALSEHLDAWHRTYGYPLLHTERLD